MPNSSEHSAKETPSEKAAAGRHHAREAKHTREHLTEAQIDKTLKDSFPASDPPAWY